MTRKAPRSGSIAPPIDYSPSGAALDHDPIRLNRIMISSFCWSMISAQTLRVCREGKPVPTFPDHALVVDQHPADGGEADDDSNRDRPYADPDVADDLPFGFVLGDLAIPHLVLFVGVTHRLVPA